MYKNVVEFVLIQLFRTNFEEQKNHRASFYPVNNLDVHKKATKTRIL